MVGADHSISRVKAEKRLVLIIQEVGSRRKEVGADHLISRVNAEKRLVLTIQ